MVDVERLNLYHKKFQEKVNDWYFECIEHVQNAWNTSKAEISHLG